MANVIVTVAGRPYTMQCPDGEEDHLRELASLLDAEVQRIQASVGSIGDIRLLVMAGRLIADGAQEHLPSLPQPREAPAKAPVKRRRATLRDRLKAPD